MKHSSKLSLRQLIPVTILLGGIGSILFGISPLIGAGLIILSMLSGLVSHYCSAAQNDHSKYLMEGLAHLLAKNQFGNVYIEALHSEIRDKGFSRQAKVLVEKALSLNPKDRQVLEYSAAMGALEINRLAWMATFRKKKYNAILAAESPRIRKIAIQGMKLYPKSHLFHDALGMLLDAERKHEDARKEFMISGRLRSDSYWKREIAVSWMLSKNYGKALEALESARLDGATGGLFSLYYGKALHAMGEFDRAEEEFEKVRRKYRQLPILLEAISHLYFDQGKFLSASRFALFTGFSLIKISWIPTLIMFQKALEALGLGMVFFVAKSLWMVGRWIPLLRTTQSFMPDEPEATFALIFWKQGNLILAETYLRRACKKLPRKAANFGNLAAILFRQGKVKEAIEANAIALSIEPENEVFNHNKESFEMGTLEDGRDIVWDAKKQKYSELKRRIE